MKNITCGNALENLVECARRGLEPDAAALAHARACPACSERWEAERRLSVHLRAMRIAASARRSPAANREALLRQFAAKHETPMGSRWLWSLAAAAMVLLAFAMLHGVQKRPPAALPVIALEAPQASAELAELQADPQYDGFIPVPFVPPLASGELVRVVHTELYPAALASLGVSVDPAWNTELPADLLMGEDGFPRAVRVSVDSDEQNF